jgi:hypothetical protein
VKGLLFPLRPVLLASSLVAACSGHAAPSLEQACANYTSVDREREATCYDVATEPDEATLMARQTESCVMTSAAPGSLVGAAYWTACTAAADDHCQGYQCAPYPAGTRQVGDPCLVATQCASLWCHGIVVRDASGNALAGSAQCGHCAARIAEGATCGTDDTCDIGLSCFQGVCRKKGLQGSPCAVWADCLGPSWVCKSTGFCDAITPDGQVCATTQDCATDTGCDLTTRVCTPYHFSQPGAACDGQVNRCEAGECDSSTSLCPTVLADGAACDPADPSTVCDNYASCFDGVCQIPDPSVCE